MEKAPDSCRRYSFHGNNVSSSLIDSFGYHNHHQAVALGMHSHPCGIEITFILDGSAVWLTEDGRAFRQTGNTLFIMPQNLRHLGKYDVITPCKLAWLILDHRYLHEIFDADAADAFRKLTMALCCKTIPLPKSFRSILNSAVETLCREEEPYRDLQLKYQLPLLLIDLLIHLKAPHTGEKSILMKTERFMMNHLHRPLNCAQLAENCGLSVSRFWNRFKQESGLTPMDFLNRKRLEKAEHLLRNSRKNITEIAFSCGFQSSQYFTTVFRKYFGLTPTQLRQKAKSQC